MAVLNKDKELKHDHKDAVIVGIYEGKIKPKKLPEDLYYATADKLKEGAYKGFGGTLLSFDEETKDWEMLRELRENIYMFSGAKTFQQTLEMSEELIDEEGNVRSFEEFEEIASGIFDKYNEDWLRAEYDTAIGQSRAASKWNDIEKNKDIRPFLQYSAVMDDHTCDICEPLDGLIAEVDDPVWDDIMPLNHFNCNCVVVQLDQDDVDEQGGADDEDEVKEWVSQSNETKNPLFNMNPGKDKAIFMDTGRNKHPYFEVPERYRELAKANFNLKIPTHD